MASNPNRPIRWGIAFLKGRLYFFSRESIIIVNRWPDMRAWRKAPNGYQWTRIRPRLVLRKENDRWTCQMERREPKIRYQPPGEYDSMYPLQGVPEPERNLDCSDAPEMEEIPEIDPGESAGKKGERSLAGYFGIPENVLAAVKPFPDRHWHLLNLVARCPEALDLIDSTPALAMALSSSWVFRRNPPLRPIRSARLLLRKPQPVIAAWLGFPEARDAVQVLRKLPKSECEIANLLYLRDLFGTCRKQLLHLPRLDGHLIQALVGERKDHYHLSPLFLRELASGDSACESAAALSLLQDLRSGFREMGYSGILHIRSIDHLIRLHDQERFGEEIPLPPFFPVVSVSIRMISSGSGDRSRRLQCMPVSGMARWAHRFYKIQRIGHSLECDRIWRTVPDSVPAGRRHFPFPPETQPINRE